MLYIEYAKFNCPSCKNKILVSSIEGQEFHHRLEKPKIFNCPECNSRIIFSKRTKYLFQFGATISFFVSPAAMFFLSNPYTAMALMIVGFIAISIGLLSQKLILVEGMAENNDFINVSLARLLNKVAHLKDHPEASDIYKKINSACNEITTQKEAIKFCENIASLCHSRAWGERCIDGDAYGWQAFLDSLNALAVSCKNEIDKNS